MQEREQVMPPAVDASTSTVRKNTRAGSPLVMLLAGLFVIRGIAGLLESAGVLTQWLSAPLTNILAWTLVVMPGILALFTLVAGAGLFRHARWAWNLALCTLVAVAIWEVSQVMVTVIAQLHALPKRFLLSTTFTALGKGIAPLGYLVMVYFLMTPQVMATFRRDQS